MKTAIVGGGAAGLMTAATILEADPSAEIFLIEKNDGLGKKVIISGGGRCNVTTGITDVRTVLTRYPRGNKFLSSAMYAFPPEKVFHWFEDHGVPLKVEEDLRVFPESNNGKDVVGVFERLFAESSLKVLLKANVIRVAKEGEQFHLFLKDQAEPLVVDRLVLTTGGQAYRHTGSTGDGYAFAQTLGHTITPLAASLNAFFTRETWPASISGLSFEKAKITAKREKNYSWTGPFLFTHKGVSGPAVFAVSGLVAFETYDQAHPLEISIDLFPDRSDEELLSALVERISQTPKKNLPNGLTGLCTKSLVEILCYELRFSLDKHAAEFSKKELLQVAHWLKNSTLHVIARGAGDEFVTAGGVDLKEVNPSTMESKLCPGLFFAGEILDIDGFTGGFNLQASWATGRLAGEHVSTH
jgi:predicted Rossmann fold flavoprotein